MNFPNRFPDILFAPDGSFSQPFLPAPHRPFEHVAIRREERAVLDRTEAWILQEHDKMRWRSVRLDPENVLETFQVALPRSINEKFTWRKLFDHDPRFPTIIDKIGVKAWLAAEGMPLRAPKLLWRGTDPDAIPETVLERRALLKAAHGWQAQLFLRPGETAMDALRVAGRRLMAHRHGLRQFEWGYGPVPPRLLVEEEVVPAPGRRLEEIKVYVFGDRIERVVRLFGRFSDIAGQVWETDAGGTVQLSETPPDVAETVDPAPVPPNWPWLMRAARILAAPFDHMRVDLLTDGETAVLNEMTVYNQAGRMARIGTDPAHPAALAWDLRRTWFLRTPQADPLLETYRTTLRAILDRAARPA